jgi:hypothetical protein
MKIVRDATVVVVDGFVVVVVNVYVTTVTRNSQHLEN